MSTIGAAKKRINAEFKSYLTSDSSLYVVKRDQDIEFLLKHCSDNNLTLFDVEENVEVKILIKKTKKNATTQHNV